MSGSNGWAEEVPLGDVLQLARNSVSVQVDAEYPNFGIYSYGRGLFHKEPISGASTSASTLYRAESGQFVYSRLFAFEGAYGYVSPEYDGAFVSNEFPLFDCDARQLDTKYLTWLFRRPSTWSEAAMLTTGMGNRRQRIKPEALYTYRIPLPPLAEQRRIVAKIESLAEKTEDARALRAKSTSLADQLCRSLIHDSADSSSGSALSQLVEWRRPDVDVQSSETYHFAGVNCFGRGVFKGDAKTGLEFSYTKLSRLKTGNFVYPKLMAWEGALGSVPEECDGLYVSPEFPVFEVDESKVLPEVLDVYFRSPSVWPRLAGSSTGTNMRRRRLNPKDFLAFDMPVPPMEVQQRLRRIRKAVLSTESAKSSVNSRLEALLPSILDRAFRGEL